MQPPKYSGTNRLKSATQPTIFASVFIRGSAMEEQSYVLTMLVANKPGVTSRVTGLFSGRGYNMESICGAPTHDPEISRITIKTKATPDQYIEIQKQLNRLIDVIKLRDMTNEEMAVKREMALVSVEITPANRTELLQVVEIFNGKVVNAGMDSYILEVTGTEDKIDAMVDLLRPLGIKKLTRSGVLALYRELDDSHRAQ
jgi:acetolactate synthase-1/3 small subunit